MKEPIKNFLKGFAIGAANVVPGVSGGTIALITNIFERLLNSLKSFDLTSLKLLLAGKFSQFAKHTDVFFLGTVFLGAVTSIITMARVLNFLFIN